VIKRYSIITAAVLLIAAIGILASCMISVEIEGDYVAPDKVHMTLVMDMNGEASPAVEVIAVGDDIYVRDPETGEWMPDEKVAEYEDYAGLEEFALGSVEYMKAFEGTSILEDEDINGITCFHIQGIINPGNMVDAAQELIPDETAPMTAELWIGKSDYLVHQMLIGIELEDDSEDTEIPISAGSFTFTYQFSRHNEPITIQAPTLID
jgi:hypothetical protein